jgi:carboxymethylenebutenolidase
MLSTKVLIGLLIILIAAAIGYWAPRLLTMGRTDSSSNINVQTGQNNANNPTPQATNVTLLLSDKKTELTKEDVEYFPGAKGYYVRPDGEGVYPGVVMIHENRGLRPEIKTMAEELAKEGYQVLAVDLYKGQVVEDQTQARSISGSFNQEEGIQNLKAATKFLRDKGVTKIASLGWCFGGKQSVELATSGEKLDATVVYYGGGMKSTVDQLRPITWPVLGVFGDKDQAIPVEKVKEFENSLNTLGVKNEVHIYPGVGHAFANPSGANYAPNETKDAWAKTLNFLNTNLK